MEGWPGSLTDMASESRGGMRVVNRSLLTETMLNQELFSRFGIDVNGNVKVAERAPALNRFVYIVPESGAIYGGKAPALQLSTFVSTSTNCHEPPPKLKIGCVTRFTFVSKALTVSIFFV